ncbi:MAG: ring,2-phenylacetyl-CoA epoxidase subunit PaaC [Chloroflexota bacterium]|jgi:ring-1,2-phenylacetyl-CoA epoxidase subunit PaaC|nr:ring,2-phenylacetyl-CoA epoxidase subunit PaaC [Chloroflexota bacterium]
MTDRAAYEPIAMDFGGAGDGRRRALALLLLSMADDEFVIGFSDSEWTGIGPILEEDVAISSLAQDELGHAQALYGLLAETVSDGRDADAWAYDRPPEGYVHARLLDHPRGDWAATIARRYLYDTADSARLAAIAESSHRPLAELVAKIRREERYHLMHVETWIERLADAGGESRERLLAALAALGADAGTVLAPLAGEPALLRHSIVSEPFATVGARWRDRVDTTFRRLGLPELPPTADPGASRSGHSDAFRALHAEFTMVRRSEAGATW